MRNTSTRKKKESPKPAIRASLPTGVKFDRALLLYPVCILAAMAVLYVVDNSIRKELPAKIGRASCRERV